MSISSANAVGEKTRRVETLTSGTSWTVPAKVLYVNATLVGGGQGGMTSNGNSYGGAFVSNHGLGGQVITTTVTTTPGASVAYAIGAGGAAGSGTGLGKGSNGGSTTFTGATTAVGGSDTVDGMNAVNGGSGGAASGSTGAGGAGQIILEYWIS